LADAGWNAMKDPVASFPATEYSTEPPGCVVHDDTSYTWRWQKKAWEGGVLAAQQPQVPQSSKPPPPHTHIRSQSKMSHAR
jgi:hypothetical protein